MTFFYSMQFYCLLPYFPNDRSIEASWPHMRENTEMNEKTRLCSIFSFEPGVGKILKKKRRYTQHGNVSGYNFRYFVHQNLEISKKQPPRPFRDAFL